MELAWPKVTQQWLKDAGHGDRVSLVSVEVSEHGANSALYMEEDFFLNN